MPQALHAGCASLVMTSRSTSEDQDVDVDDAACSPTLQPPGLFPIQLDQPALSEDWWPLSELPQAEAGLGCASTLEADHSMQPAELLLDSQGSEGHQLSQPAEHVLDESGSDNEALATGVDACTRQLPRFPAFSRQSEACRCRFCCCRRCSRLSAGGSGSCASRQQRAAWVARSP